MLFFVLSKVPEAGTLAQNASHFLHEVLWAKGYRVNTLGSASRVRRQQPTGMHSHALRGNEKGLERAFSKGFNLKLTPMVGCPPYNIG